MSRSKEIVIGANTALAALHACVHLYQFVILPWLLLPRSPAWAWSLVPLALLHNPFWSLIHEGIHDLFHPSPRVNRLFGRVAGIAFGSPFRILRMSHLLHHKLNRTLPEATEVFDPATGSRLRSAGGYYFQIFGGLYLGELMSSLLFFLPRSWLVRYKNRFLAPQSVSGILMQSWTAPEALREIRIDGAAALAWLGFSFWLYGAYWPLAAAILAGRGLLISFLDNVYHYGTPVNDVFYASNLRLPAAARAMLLNFNLHGIHHQFPSAPWHRLPALYAGQAATFQGGYFRAAARQLGGPLALGELPANRDAMSL